MNWHAEGGKPWAACLFSCCFVVSDIEKMITKGLRTGRSANRIALSDRACKDKEGWKSK